MSLFEAFLIGIIQGLTEFLPVSSSGHIELSKAILGIESKDSLLFSILVHFATALATVVVFRKDIWHIGKDVFSFKKTPNAIFGYLLLLSAIPVLVVGLFFKDQIEGLFIGNVVLVSLMLLVTSSLLLFTWFSQNPNGKVGFWRAIIIGIAQAVAVLPGISRSGATISMAIILKIDRSEAARFSFLMVLIPIFGATFLELLDFVQEGNTREFTWPVLIAGFLAAFFSGLLACNWMISLVKKGKLIYFALYCAIIGFSGLIYSIFLS